MAEKKRSLAPIIILAVVIVAVIVLAIVFDANTYLLRAMNWIRDIGTVGVLVFIGLYIALTVLAIPGSILTLAAGAVYGVVYGSIYVSIASTLGATAAFLVGRYVARDSVAARIEGNARFAAIDQAVGKEGWKIVGLTRLSPIFPFNALNYGYGVTNVSLRDYFFASWIGMMPGTVMYVYIGTLAGDLATIGAGEERARTTGEWILLGVGFVATVVVTLFVTRLARKALGSRIDLDETPEGSEASAE